MVLAKVFHISHSSVLLIKDFLAVQLEQDSEILHGVLLVFDLFSLKLISRGPVMERAHKHGIMPDHECL